MSMTMNVKYAVLIRYNGSMCVVCWVCLCMRFSIFKHLLPVIMFPSSSTFKTHLDVNVLSNADDYDYYHQQLSVNKFVAMKLLYMFCYNYRRTMNTAIFLFMCICVSVHVSIGNDHLYRKW